MNQGLSSNRTVTSRNTSSSLYGGDVDMSGTDDLDQYWTNGGAKKGSSKKKKQQQKGQKNKFDHSNGNGQEEAKHTNKKQKKTHTPIGYTNLGYGLIDESSSLVFSTSKVLGVCQNLEKDYLRLTSAADPANVRPPSVLANALSMVKRKWIDSQDYEYVCNQLKSIRQDCTVQHIRNTFAVEVYETHARIALESGDYQEFAACQTQLQLLYKDGHSNGFERECEFAAYKILYACLMTGPSDSGLVSFMNALDDDHQEHEAVKHALLVRTSLLTTNFHSFFNLWSTAPNMSGYLMDPLADSMRQRSARILISAYRPRISLVQLTRTLAFDRDEDEELNADGSSKPPSVAAQKECKTYLDTKFEGAFVWIKEPPKDGLGAGKLYVDCKVTHDKLAPSNAAHRLPINSARARHSISSTSTASASPAHAPIAGPHDVGMWIKKDAAAVTGGRIKLGRLDDGLTGFSLSGSTNGQPPRSSPTFSPSPSPSPPVPPPIPNDPVSRKRANSQPLSSMSYDELKTAIDGLEAELLDPNVKETYDDFSLSLMMSRLKALQKQFKKTKKPK